MYTDPLANFLALLQFHIQAGDTVLSEHLQTAASNALYTSKMIQNEIIAMCGNIIRQNILDSIKEALFFSIIADEAIASYPGREGEGKKRPGTYCMRMREVPQQNLGLRIRPYIFCIFHQYVSVNYSVSFR